MSLHIVFFRKIIAYNPLYIINNIERDYDELKIILIYHLWIIHEIAFFCGIIQTSFFLFPPTNLYL